MSEQPPGGFRLDEALAPPDERRLRDLPGLLGASIAMVRTAAPRELAVTAALQMLVSAGLAAQLFVARGLLSHLLIGHQRGYAATIPYVAALAVIIAVIGIANTARHEIQRTLAELVARYAMSRVLEMSAAVDLLAFENPAFHDRQQRALVNSVSRPLQMTNGLTGLIGGLLSSAGIGVVLLTVQPILFVMVLVAFVPVWIATVLASRAIYRYALEQTESDRRRFYLQMVLSNKDTAKEVRAYDAERFLKRRYDGLYAQRISALRDVVRRRTRQGVIGAALTGAMTGAALGAIIWLVAHGHLSLAGAGVASGAIVLLGAQLQGLSASAGAIYESSLFVRDFTSFVALMPDVLSQRGQARLPPRLDAVVTRQVGFTYPSRKEPSLVDITVELPRGKVVALVGPNGSGKTTLAKVLAGLFPPTEGTVLWNGVDLSTVDPADLRARVAVLFQDFIRYQLSAHENIAFGNHAKFDDRAAVRAAATSAGADAFLATLPNGYDSTLGPEYIGGVDLSGGQWQRIALARAFMRDAELIILDEPTASLDAQSESDLFGRVRELFAGRTVLLISHRFASVRLADHIYVLERGRVIESGDHAQLLSAQGAYARMFTLQSRAFGLADADDPPWDADR